MLISINNKLEGIIGVADTVKENSRKAIQAIHNMGIKVAMVGDGINDAPTLRLKKFKAKI